MSNVKTYEVVKGLIFYGGRALFLEKEDFIGGKYDVPGGKKLNQKESDETALKREVMEEVGLRITIGRLLNQWKMFLPEKQMRFNGRTYLCETDSNKIKLSNEHTGYRWFDKGSLNSLDCPNWLKEAISKL